MGMYDTITCELALENLPEEIIKRYGSSEEVCFQTKSLDNALDLFKINKNGELLRKKIRVELINDGDPNAESFLDRLPQYDHIDEGWEETKFNGSVDFYDYYDGEEKTDRGGWIEYSGLFVDGILQGEIKQINHELPRNHTQEELDRIQKIRDEWDVRRKRHNEEKLQIIEEYKNKIAQLSEMQDFIYQNLLEKLNISDSHSIEEWLYDYIYNNTEYSLEKIKEQTWI